MSTSPPNMYDSVGKLPILLPANEKPSVSELGVVGPQTLVASLRKPYHSKRTHSKSRKGCLSCKTRKVKCDEAQPTCRRCFVREAECVYPPTTTSSIARPSRTVGHSPQSRSSSHSPGSSSPASSDSLLSPFLCAGTGRDSADLRLLWFYTTSSYNLPIGPQSGERADRLDNVLKIKLPQLAFENSFLMDCVLATAALQLRLLDQDVSTSRALQYRARGIEGYRQAILEPSEQTTPALALCSILIANISTDMFRDKEVHEICIVDWMMIWRGINTLISVVTSEKLQQLGVVEPFMRPDIDLIQSGSYIPDYLIQMVFSIGPDDPEYADANTYYVALQYLGSLFAELSRGIGSLLILRTLTWLTVIPKSFVELCRTFQPRALVILAHFLIFLKLLGGRWWAAQGIGQREITCLLLNLSGAWHEQLYLPRQALSVNSELGLARLLLDDPEWEIPEKVPNQTTDCKLSCP
ncbi:unnamed protein product [Clonostachys chloroleuca]|uniref:Zn(2)-C6 fungal-type domain-containing protein n=1 Tax=Clonostachys chloroleuca TaxID=1926264 RepID=A0AA35Q5B3_9HYPO|nr:unnamed protein product [Clonostachys chloroleuca]